METREQCSSDIFKTCAVGIFPSFRMYFLANLRAREYIYCIRRRVWSLLSVFVCRRKSASEFVQLRRARSMGKRSPSVLISSLKRKRIAAVLWVLRPSWPKPTCRAFRLFLLRHRFCSTPTVRFQRQNTHTKNYRFCITESHQFSYAADISSQKI